MPATVPRSALLPCALLLGACRSPLLEMGSHKRADDEVLASAAEQIASFRKIVYRSADGLPIPAYLFVPREHHGGPGAAVIFLHGGEHGTFGSSRLHRVESLLDLGLVVLAPDYRGSSGYSRRFHDAADYGGGEIDDVLAARDWLAAEGLADGGRIAVLGFSHGGYIAALACARRPDGFAACVDYYGPTDIVYRVTSTPEENPNAAPGDPAKFARMVGATLEEDEAAYRERSPRFVADRIRAPVLIVHGTQDGVVGIRESEWLAEALGEAGHPDFELVVVEGGKHGYPREAYRGAWEATLRFLGGRLRLGGRP